MPTPLNYATQYQRELDQAFPVMLRFGALYATPNNGRYRWVNGKTIEIPHISTKGRVNASRDTIGQASRNYDNSWQTKTLANERKWSTLVHPMDVDETNMTTTIGNITKTFNEEQKFPEMDAYLISKIFSDWSTDRIVDATDVAHDTYVGRTADSRTPTTANVLEIFDDLMLKMDNANVPDMGRILYVTYEVLSILKSAQGISRSFDVQSGNSAIKRTVDRLEQVQVIGVPASLMKTKYNFYEGYAPTSDAKQIAMFLVHPMAVITPHKYSFSQLEAPSALSEGKYVYFEEDYEDVFILDYKADAIQFCVPNEDVLGFSLAPNTGTIYSTVSIDTLQEGIAINGNSITGTVKYVADGLTDLGYEADEHNFIALDYSFASGATVTCKTVGGAHSGRVVNLVASDADKLLVSLTPNKYGETKQKLYITVVNGTETANYIYDFKGLKILSE